MKKCFLKFLLLFNYSCMPFLPIPPPSPTSTLPLDFVHVSFIVVPENPSPSVPSPLSSGYCYIVLNFSVVIFCLLFSFVDYVPVKDEIIWYLSFTAWLISLSIILSSSIHAVAKGRSSFFLCAALSITKKVLQCVNIPVF